MDPLDSEVQEKVEEVVIEEPLKVEVEELFDTGDVLFEESNFEEGESINLVDSSDELGSRSDGNRQQLLRKYGGSAASEEAVALALKWIANHQLPDGGWNLDHRIGPGNHRGSPNPGSLIESPNAATALRAAAVSGQWANSLARQLQKRSPGGPGIPDVTRQSKRPRSFLS